MNKRTTCCFTGHRPHKAPLLVDYANPRYKELENAVALEILTKAIAFRCDTFRCGMAQGADMLCGSLVLKLRHIYKLPMRLVCVIPCLSQAQAWEVAHSSHMIALLDPRLHGGTAYTVSLARQNRLDVRILNPSV